jgi:hypothetical protein
MMTTAVMSCGTLPRQPGVFRMEREFCSTCYMNACSFTQVTEAHVGEYAIDISRIHTHTRTVIWSTTHGVTGSV